MTLWFVTPAWKRFDLTAVCLDQRQQVIKHLAAHGIEAHCVVVADDENLDLARAAGFDTVEQNNEWLGRRFNDGIEYAGKHGAEWIVPIGSDSWIDPAYFLPASQRPRRNQPSIITRTSKFYSVVETNRLATLAVGVPGAGPFVFNRRQLRAKGFRPAVDQIHSGVDGSTIAGIGRIRWSAYNLHPLQYVGFRGTPHITSYESLWEHWGVEEHHNPWELLAQHYDSALVERARLALNDYTP